jgi:hypothetical protein
VPRVNLEQTAKDALSGRIIFKEQFQGIKGKSRAKEGDVGYLDKRGMTQIGEHIFVINEDAPSFTSPQGNILNGRIIKPVMVDGKFQVKQCCRMVFNLELGREKYCYEHYVFDILSVEGLTFERISYGEYKCGIFNHLTVLPEENQTELRGISSLLNQSLETSSLYPKKGIDNFEIILAPTEWEGSRRITQSKAYIMKLPIDPETGLGPYNMRHYKPDDKANSDIFMIPKSMCAFLEVAKNFNEVCKEVGCQLQFGDIYHDVDWSEHESHGTGECVDIRPFRKNTDDITKGNPIYHYKKNAKGETVLDYKRQYANYDRDKTRQFMELAIQAGATHLFINDPVLYLEHFTPKVREKILPVLTGTTWDDWWKIRGSSTANKRNHNDHMHLCFREENPRVQEACQPDY